MKHDTPEKRAIVKAANAALLADAALAASEAAREELDWQMLMAKKKAW